ncbi:MAG: hypothetical protein AAF208_10700 [Cyanobacteria bacterium P01_A01_bin.45]
MTSDNEVKAGAYRKINTDNGNYNENINGNNYNIQGNYYASEHLESRCLRVLVHRAVFMDSIEKYYFINLTNLSQKREIVATHIWLESDPELHIFNRERRLPKRLKPDESWETWIEVEKIPEPIRNNPYNFFRVRLTNGDIVKSVQNRNVPKMGTVPGDEIESIVQPQEINNSTQIYNQGEINMSGNNESKAGGNRKIHMGSGNYNERIEGDYIQQQGSFGVGVNKGEIKADKVAGTINEAQQKNLAEAAAEIQELLEQLSKTYDTDTYSGKGQIADEIIKNIENNPGLKARLLSALKTGSVKAFEQFLNHPAASFVIGALEDWEKTKGT